MATTKPKDKDKSKTGATTTPTATPPAVGASAAYTPTVIDKPTIQTPTGTYEDYYKSSYDSQIGAFTPGYEALQKSNEEYLQGFDSSVDTQTAAATSAYQQKIDAAPAMSRPLYDANAIDEKINRKKVQENMANMGLTDSGLSSSMQTAIAIQKSNADHQVRQQERAYVQDLETAIANIFAQGESTKQAERARINKETADYYANGIANISASAATAASDAYAADWDNALKLYGIENDNWQFLQGQAHDITMENVSHMNEVELLGWKTYYEQENMKLDAELKDALAANDHERAVELEGIKATNEQNLAIINGQIDLGKAQISADQKNSAAYTDLVTYLIEQGVSNNDAAIYAAVISGGTGNEATDAWNQRYIEARQNGASESDAVTYADGDDNILTDVKTDNDLAVVEKFVGTLGSLDFSSFFGDVWGAGNLFGTWFKGPEGDGRVVASHIKKTLNNSKGFGILTETQKNMAIQYAIAQAINTGWSKGSDDEKNITRIKSACKDMGFSDDATEEVINTYRSMRA